MYVVNTHGPLDLFSEHLSKAEVYFLVFHWLNLYSLKCILLLNFRPVLLGAPSSLQLGALSARLVRLWVNPALLPSFVTIVVIISGAMFTTFRADVQHLCRISLLTFYRSRTRGQSSRSKSPK